jgi:hypothetical protein
MKMRINIYAEEVTDRVEKIDRIADNAPKVVFTGIQFFTGRTVEHTPGDDDSSAVTFFYNDDYSRDALRSAFKKALELLEANPPQINEPTQS